MSPPLDSDADNDAVTQKHILKDFALSAVRHLLTAIAGVLVTHGYVSGASAKEYVGAAAAVIVSLVWSYANKAHLNDKIDVALGLPEGTTREALEDTVKEAYHA